MKIPLSYYQKEDVVALAKNLLGKVICTNINGELTKAIITETEAYNGIHDKACHAYNNRRTPRTEIMFQPGGYTYIYLCYGIHHLFNIVTGVQDDPTAVLIRSVEPLLGIETMQLRRNKSDLNKLTTGPGTLSQALGIRTDHTGILLSEKVIWLEDHGIRVESNSITASPRIGIDYAEEDALLPYRFVWDK